MSNNKDKTLFLNYPKCSTCVKAGKWLEENAIDFVGRHIIEENPTEKELKQYIKKSGLPIKKFFNTSGVMYREMELKDRLRAMSDDEKIKLLSTNGKLLKRPIIVNEKGVLVGFKIDEWKEFFNK